MNIRSLPPTLLVLLAAMFASPAPAAADDPPADDGVFVEGSRYSAVLYPGQGAWRLLQMNGGSLRLQVRDECRAGTAPPHGLWLLTRDALGRPQLLAPSATPLPPGHPGRIALVPCGEPLPEQRPALAVPESLLGWLGQHSGVIYVTR